MTALPHITTVTPMSNTPSCAVLLLYFENAQSCTRLSCATCTRAECINHFGTLPFGIKRPCCTIHLHQVRLPFRLFHSPSRVFEDFRHAPIFLTSARCDLVVCKVGEVQ